MSGQGSLARSAGSAVIWKAVQLGAVRLISIARYLVLARLLTPNDFGLFAIAVVAVEFVYGITDVGMTPALVQQAPTDSRMYDAAWTIGLVRAALLATAIIVAAPWIAQFFDEPRATMVLRALALRPVIGALGSVRVAELERRLEFRRLAMITVPAAVIGAATAIVLARTMGVWALVNGTLVGTGVSATLSYVLAPYRPRIVFDAALARPLLRFGRWVLVAAMLGAGADAALRAIIARRLSTSDLGVYFLATSLAMLPNQTIGVLIGGVAFPLHARLKDDARRVAETFRMSILAMSVVLLPVYALLFVLAPAIVRDVLDPRWADSVATIRILSLAGPVGIGFGAAAPLLEGVGRPARVAVLYAVFAAVLIVLASVLTGTFGLSGAALSVLVAELVTMIAAMFFAGQYIARPLEGLAVPLLAIGATSIGAAALGFALAREGQPILGGVTALAVAVSVAAVVGVSVLRYLDRRLRLGLADTVVSAFPALRGLVLRDGA